MNELRDIDFELFAFRIDSTGYFTRQRIHQER